MERYWKFQAKVILFSHSLTDINLIRKHFLISTLYFYKILLINTAGSKEQGGDGEYNK